MHKVVHWRGNYLNLTDYSMGDGAKTWNDQAVSAIVKVNEYQNHV